MQLTRAQDALPITRDYMATAETAPRSAERARRSGPKAAAGSTFVAGRLQCHF